MTSLVAVASLLAWAGSAWGSAWYWGVIGANSPKYDGYVAVLVQGGERPSIACDAKGNILLEGGGTVLGIATLGKDGKDFVASPAGIPRLCLNDYEWNGVVLVRNCEAWPGVASSLATMPYAKDPFGMLSVAPSYYMIVFDRGIVAGAQYRVVEQKGLVSVTSDADQHILFTMNEEDLPTVPEPGVAIMIALGGAALLMVRRRKQ